jgi:protein-S-isoprenylcysteine O-methyltransferase Ste14
LIKNPSKIGEKLFSLRGILGFPLFLVAIIFEKPNLNSCVLGFSILIFGEFIRIVSVAYSGPTTRARRLVAPKLITNGPYGYVRNPLYLGNFLIGLGFLIATRAFFPWFQIAFIPLFFAEYLLIVKAEEKFLEEKFGREYSEYKKRVRRFIPKLKKFDSPNPVKPNFREAVRSERSTFYLLLSLTFILLLTWSLSASHH